METGRTNRIGADQRQRRRPQPQDKRAAPEDDVQPEEAHARPRAPRAVKWPADYYMTAQEWMEKVRLIRR